MDTTQSWSVRHPQHDYDNLACRNTVVTDEFIRAAASTPGGPSTRATFHVTLDALMEAIPCTC